MLAGATRTLQSVRLLMLELSIVPYNRGQVQVFEMHALMDRLGFAMYDVLELHYLKSRAGARDMLIQLDVLFLRKTDELWSEKETGFAPPAGWATGETAALLSGKRVKRG